MKTIRVVAAIIKAGDTKRLWRPERWMGISGRKD